MEGQPSSWWDSRREPVQLALEIPIGPDSDSPKPPKVRKSCFIIFGAILLRILGLIASVAILGYGGWTFYQITKYLYLEGIVKIVAQGAFLFFLGTLSLIAELRTRWTMRGCINTYIIFANYLARGVIYVALGAILWALEYYNPPIVKKEWLAGGILAVGVLNILFYPFYWRHERAVSISKAHSIAMEPYPEEIIYGMDTLYIKNHMQHNQRAATSTSPRIVQGKIVEGANEVSPALSDKETPGGPEPFLYVEPKPKALPATLTSSHITANTCADILRHSSTIDVITGKPIGVGAS